MDCIVPGVTKSQTRLSNFRHHFTFIFTYFHYQVYSFSTTAGKTITNVVV